MYHHMRPLIFRLDPEQAHAATVTLLQLAGALPPIRALLRTWFRPTSSGPAAHAFGLTFANPIGLAAGYDKDGRAWRGLATLGFGHIEIGTVTPRPQPGNTLPRIFRLPEDRAVVNRMGFPNRGAEYVAARLQGPRPAGLTLGVNIGKNKTTPLEEAAEDYLDLIRTFAPLADYLAINVSSPNTPDLRKLQARAALEALLVPLARERNAQVQQLGRRVPLLVKLAPDLTDAELSGALEAITTAGLDGVIVSNTSVARGALRSSHAAESGGLSGAPIKRRNTELVAAVTRYTGGKLPVIASGGVMRPEDVAEKLDAGAKLVQLYTGLIYAGPGLVKQVLEHGLPRHSREAYGNLTSPALQGSIPVYMPGD